MSTQINDGGPAFPCVHGMKQGMTLRDWFAGQALCGMLACLAHPSSIGARLMDNGGVPAEAFQWADAMLAARTGETYHNQSTNERLA